MIEDYEFYHTDPYEPDYTDFTKLIAREDYDALNKPWPLADLVELFMREWGETWGRDKVIAKCTRWNKKDWELYEAKIKSLGLD